MTAACAGPENPLDLTLAPPGQASLVPVPPRASVLQGIPVRDSLTEGLRRSLGLELMGQAGGEAQMQTMLRLQQSLILGVEAGLLDEGISPAAIRDKLEDIRGALLYRGDRMIGEQTLKKHVSLLNRDGVRESHLFKRVRRLF